MRVARVPSPIPGSRAKTERGRSRALDRLMDVERGPILRCCRPRMLSPSLGEGRIVRVIEQPCPPIVALSLVPDPDGTWPSMEELRRRVAALPPPPRRVSLPVWR